MKDDPFKVRVSDHRPKEPLVLTESQLNQLIAHSKGGQELEATEQALLEERQRRREATKALSKQVTRKSEPGSEKKKRQYAVALQSARQELARDSRIETRRNQVLEHAYRRLYEETDRVKHFRQSRNLAEMLKQRDLQLEAKSNMSDLFGQLDKGFVLGMFRDVENHAEEEAYKLKVARRDKLKNADNWDKQRKQNCPVFWPQSGSLYQGSIKIEHLSSEPEYFGGVLVRKFRIKNPKGKTRTVKTFHLHGWRREEFVPPQVDTVVQLIAKVDKWTRKNATQAPVLVTCYDGCRAAGFFCASSYLAGQIHDTGQADVVQAVRTVRLNRPAFVPTVEQYRWLYELACFLVSEKILK